MLPENARRLTSGIAVLFALLTIAGCAMVPYEERHPEIAVLENFPDCDHEVIDRLRVSDGHNPVTGQSRDWATRANMDRALAKLREQTAQLDARAAVISHRTLSHNRDGTLEHIELHAVAISECR